MTITPLPPAALPSWASPSKKEHCDDESEESSKTKKKKAEKKRQRPKEDEKEMKKDESRTTKQKSFSSPPSPSSREIQDDAVLAQRQQFVVASDPCYTRQPADPCHIRQPGVGAVPASLPSHGHVISQQTSFSSSGQQQQEQQLISSSSDDGGGATAAASLLEMALSFSKNNNKRIIIRQPGPNDILLGRGRPFQNYAGNRKMVKLICKFENRYNETRKDKRRAVGEEIVDEILKTGARFLEKVEQQSREDQEPGEERAKSDGETTTTEGATVDTCFTSSSTGAFVWEEVSREIAFEKVTHVIRGKRRAKKSKEKKSCNDDEEEASGDDDVSPASFSRRQSDASPASGGITSNAPGASAPSSLFLFNSADHNNGSRDSLMTPQDNGSAAAVAAGGSLSLLYSRGGQQMVASLPQHCHSPHGQHVSDITLQQQPQEEHKRSDHLLNEQLQQHIFAAAQHLVAAAATAAGANPDSYQHHLGRNTSFASQGNGQQQRYLLRQMEALTAASSRPLRLEHDDLSRPSSLTVAALSLLSQQHIDSSWRPGNPQQQYEQGADNRPLFPNPQHQYNHVAGNSLFGVNPASSRPPSRAWSSLSPQHPSRQAMHPPSSVASALLYHQNHSSPHFPVRNRSNLMEYQNETARNEERARRSAHQPQQQPPNPEEHRNSFDPSQLLLLLLNQLQQPNNEHNNNNNNNEHNIEQNSNNEQSKNAEQN